MPVNGLLSIDPSTEAVNSLIKSMLGMVDGKRKRLNFKTKAEAETCAEQARVNRANEGMAAFTLPTDIRLDAVKANSILAPHGVTILEAAKYYEKHVLAIVRWFR